VIGARCVLTMSPCRLCFSGQIMDRGLSVADWIRNGEEVGELEVDLNRPNTEKGLVTIRRRMTRSTVILTRAKASLRLTSACAPLSRLACGPVVFTACPAAPPRACHFSG
jgi:hypothetical protein